MKKRKILLWTTFGISAALVIAGFILPPLGMFVMMPNSNCANTLSVSRVAGEKIIQSKNNFLDLRS